MRRAILTAAAAGLVLVTAAQARVFWRWRGSDAPGRALVQAGAERGYTAAVAINGAEAEAEVFRLPGRNMTGALALLGRTFPDMTFAHAGGNLALGHDDKRRNTLILIRPAGGGSVTVFAIRTGGTPVPPRPDRHLLEHLPPFPGSRPVFHALDRNTGASLAVATASAPPHAVAEFYAGQLAAEGWISALPISHGRSQHVFLRNREIATVTAVRDDTGRTTRITLLHKEPGRIRD